MATPRELQFFVVGIVVGVGLLATLRALGVTPDGVIFVIGVPIAAVFMALSMARS